jgi:epoxyqueuosine reductase
MSNPSAETDAARSKPRTTALEVKLKAEAVRLGFEAVGITEVRPSDHAAFYRAWIQAGHHGTMDYLAREDAVERRLRPESFRSAVVVALNYFPGPDDDGDASSGVIARYARGRDYHKVIKRKLLALLSWLEAELGRELPLARAYVDTGPVLERELAQRAGLGWFGRNTMLLHPQRGSYYFLGSLLLDIELTADEPFAADHCGTCNACVSACPTGALLGRNNDGAPVIDATRCISYLTIENRGPIPRELRSLMGNRVFGCDICQEVCPFTGKFSRPSSEPDFSPRPGMTSPSLVELMRLSPEAWDEFTRGSPVRRARREGLLRNVAVALGNWASEEAVPPLLEALSDSEPLVRGHAAWALGEIASPSASAALAERLSVEDDSWVREELDLALARFSERSSSRGRSGANLSVT